MTRKLLYLIAAGLLAATPTAAAAFPPSFAPPDGWADRQAPGFYRLRLGDFRITVLSDGAAARDLSTIMSKPDAVRAAYAAAHETLPVDLSINCYLVDTGARRILVDVGAGELFGVAAGRLEENLRAAGYAPEDIDVILLTHIHGDHSGGLSVGGEPVFPNAVVYVDRRDPALWLDPRAASTLPPGRQATVAQSHRTVDPVVRAGRLRTFDGATEFFPGVRSVPEPGHTPGLNGFMIESRGERLLIWGDVVHSAEVQFEDPTVTIEYDVDADEAAATRSRVLADAAAEGYLVGGAHLSFPGLGHVRRDAPGYAWAPAPYRATP